MLRRRLLLLLVLTALAFSLAWLKISRFRPPPPEPAPAAVVPIEEGKTIDFSSGRAEVRDSAADRAALEKALAEMKAAEAGITLPPRPPPK